MEPRSFVGAILLLPEPEWAAGCWPQDAHLSCTSHHNTRYCTSNYIDSYLNQCRSHDRNKLFLMKKAKKGRQHPIYVYIYD